MSGVPAAAPAPRTSALAALQHRDFAVFAGARFCATLAWQILGATVGYQIYQITRDPLYIFLRCIHYQALLGKGANISQALKLALLKGDFVIIERVA